MSMKYGVDRRPRAIDFGVDRKLQRRLDIAAVNRLAVEIDRNDVLDGERGAHRGAGIDVERTGAGAYAAMAVVIDIFRVLQHANGIHKFLLVFVLRRLTHDSYPSLGVRSKV